MEVVWLLDGNTLSGLRRATERSSGAGPGGRTRVPLEAFVTELYRALCFGSSSDHGVKGRSQAKTRQLVERVCVLFDLVDVDSAGVIDWVDFTDFCVYIRGRDSGNQGQEDDSGVLTSEYKRVQDSNITRFAEKLGYIDRSSHCHEIRSMRFVKGIDLLLVVEGTAILKIYSAGLHKVGQIEPAISVRKLMIDNNQRSKKTTANTGKPQSGSRTAARSEGSATAAKGQEDGLAVLAVEYIGHVNRVAVACADGYLTVWEINTYNMLSYTRLKDVQVGLRFCPAMNVLTSWGVDDFNHEILVWDVDTLKILHVLDGHCEPVKDICELAPPPSSKIIGGKGKKWDPMLVTAAMDGKVVMWDLQMGSGGKYKAPKKLFILIGHYHGVLSLAYSDEHDFILSAGFDFDANCWDRSTSHLHMKLAGHTRSLIGVIIVEHETQRAVTGDEGGSFRIWDIRRGHSDHGACLQSFSLRNTRASPRTMTVVWRGGLVVAGSKMHAFRAARNVTVGASPSEVWFSSYTGELCVLLREAVLLDASTGQVKRRTFQQTHGREITAFCIDARHKKAVVGDQRGGLRGYDVVTGRWVMSATPHRSEVSALLFIDEDDAFISAGWDRTIQVHDARVRSCSSARPQGLQLNAAEQPPVGHRYAALLRSVIDAHDGDITLMAASLHLGLLATASNDLTVRVWDYGLLRLEEIIVAHRQEITCVSFLDPLPCLATADMTGKILVWATRPHLNAKSLLLVIRNTVITAGGVSAKAWDSGDHARAQRKVLPVPVTCIAFRDTTAFDADTVSRGTPQPEVPAERAPDCEEADSPEKSPQSPPRQPVEGRRLRPSTEPSTSYEVGSTLFTGDELGSIKAWDLTDVLLHKLGPATYGASRTEDKTAPSPTSSGRKTHQSVHHRPGPLDGVALQAALRFAELIEIAKAIRRGDDLTPARLEVDRNKCHLRGRPGSKVRAGSKEALSIERKLSPRGQSTRSASESPSEHSVVSKITATGRSRNRCQASRRRQAPDTERHRGKPGESNIPASSRVASNVSNGKHIAGPESEIQEEVEAVLNAGVDTISPIRSWVGHENSVTSMKVIPCPPSLITGSLDGSARIFSLEGSLLGVIIDQDASGKAPWLFRPPPHGRKTEASARATALEEKLRSVRRTERVAVPSNVPSDTGLSGDPRLGDRWKESGRINPQLRAPANGCGFGTASTGTKSERSGPRQGGEAEGGLSTEAPAIRTAREIGDETQEMVNMVLSRPSTSAVCLSRVKELAQQARVVPEVGSGRQQASQESIDETLLSEARERYQTLSDTPSPTFRPRSRGGGERDRHLDFHSTRTSREAWEQPTPGKINANLNAEHQRKNMKRTRSALQFLSSSISRTGGRAGIIEQGCRRPSTAQPQGSAAERARKQLAQEDTRRRPSTSSGVRANSQNELSPKGVNKKALRYSEQDDLDGDSATVVGLAGCSSASGLGDGVAIMAPTLTLRLGVKCPKSSTMKNGGARDQDYARNKGGAILLTQRSAATAAPGKLNVSPSADVSRKLATDRRHRRMDGILDGVRRIGLHEKTPPSLLSSKHGGSSARGVGRDSATVESSEATGQEHGGASTTAAVVSTRVREVLSRFERRVNGDEDNRGGPADPNEQGGKLDGGIDPRERRRRNLRIAAKQAAVRQNERYRHAQTFNLTTLQKTQQRRQEAIVGLTGPSGERFGPYSLDDVLDFQIFAHYLSAQGADHMTLRGLMDNPGIQADPYSHALLQELARSRVLQWNRALSFEELMQLVFHFAKHEEIKRMASIMDITLLLERVRDAFLADRGSLLGADGVLSSHFANEIDVTFRTNGADVHGTCTTKDLHGIMARVGSDLFSHGLEDLKALAAQCGIVDGHKELTSADLTAVIVKLVSLHPAGRSGPRAHA